MSRTTYRLTATWPTPAPRVQFQTSDRKRLYSKARTWAGEGAVVVIEKARGARWLPDTTLDGPAMLAEQHQTAEMKAAARRAAVEAELAARTSRFVDTLLAEHNQAEHHRHARLMQAPPVPRRSAGRLAAAHVVAGRGIR
ncbi:hypothetical protein ACFU7T_25570 [Streptomyces sp. NPDC057555]|uniref:hypothetical protein n=1 Tax=Streptomyces sp. NPDC057555 TaxID=3346166 RepID=UPI0036B2D60D